MARPDKSGGSAGTSGSVRVVRGLTGAPGQRRNARRPLHEEDVAGCLNVRSSKPGLPILHIGSTIPAGLPADVPTLAETFTAESLLLTVQALMEREPMSMAPHLAPLPALAHSYPNGRRWSDSGMRPEDPRGRLEVLVVEPVPVAVADQSGMTVESREAQDHLARILQDNRESLHAAPRRRSTDAGA
jgi:hypothetical protein